MSLSAGTRLGVYEVLDPLGTGGMGEVYRARDTKLQRYVALKILPQAFALDPERLARFTREAQTLAALNHPNIAGIYGIEESGAVRALVMEFVDGEDLSQRLARGAMPLDEALPIARQIADALEAAHESGIVHRDLKPANVKIRSDGTVKVLDFGLAKTFAPRGPGPATPSPGNSPTFTSPAMTGMGVVLGTAAYMSPEQARGAPVDKRADIWAFGVLLYEMVTGRPLFEGTNTTDLLAAVVRQDIDWATLPETTPTAVRQVLRRCLERDPRDRLRDIGEARVLLRDGAKREADAMPARPRPHRRAVWPWVFGASCLAIAGFSWIALRSASAPETVRFTIPASASMPLQRPSTSPVLAVSRDGRQIAFTSTGALWLWTAQAGEPRRLEDTENAVGPFFSPEGREIAFFAGDELRRLPLSGGPSTTITRAPAGSAGVWAPGGLILYNRWIGPEAGLWSVPAAGGVPRLVARASKPTDIRAFPDVLPDGRHYVYLSGAYGMEVGKRHICVASLDGGEPDCSASGDSNAMYSGTGHLLFVRRGTLMALPFDATRNRASGEAVSLVKGIHWFGPTGLANFAVSADGRVLVHAPAPGPSRLVWLDRSGRQLSEIGKPERYGRVQIAPDRKHAAVEIWNSEREGRDLFLLDLMTGVTSRLTFDPIDAFQPTWSPDGQLLAFSRPTPGPPDVAVLSLDSSAPPRILLAAPGVQAPEHWSPDGQRLAIVNVGAEGSTGREVWLLSMDGSHVRLRDTPAESLNARFSPDGRFIAYVSYESGNAEVYVAPATGAGPSRRLSRAGGFTPRWRGDGRELFFEQPDSVIAAVNPFTDAPAPQLLMHLGGMSPTDAEFPRVGPSIDYDVAPDGQRFLVRVRSSDRNEGLRVAINWLPKR